MTGVGEVGLTILVSAIVDVGKGVFSASKTRYRKKFMTKDWVSFYNNGHLQKAVLESFYESIITIGKIYNRTLNETIKLEYDEKNIDTTKADIAVVQKELKSKITELNSSTDVTLFEYSDIKHIVSSLDTENVNQKRLDMKYHLIKTALTLEFEILNGREIDSLYYRKLMNDTLLKHFQKQFALILKDPAGKQKEVYKIFVSQYLSNIAITVEDVHAKLDLYIEEIHDELIRMNEKLQTSLKENIDITKENINLSKELLKKIERNRFSLSDDVIEYVKWLNHFNEYYLIPNYKLLKRINHTLTLFIKEYKEINQRVEDGELISPNISERISDIDHEDKQNRLLELFEIIDSTPENMEKEKVREKYIGDLETELNRFRFEFELNPVNQFIEDKKFANLSYKHHAFRNINKDNFYRLKKVYLEHTPKLLLSKFLVNNEVKLINFSSEEVFLDQLTTLNVSIESLLTIITNILSDFDETKVRLL